MNRHQFEQAAKHFRAGRITLSDFSAKMFPQQHPDSSAPSGSESESAMTLLPKRPVDAHKGDFGRVLMVGGSCDMPGAIGLAGLAALRSGSGLVIVATPAHAATRVASYSPCYMTCGYDNPPQSSEELNEKIEWADVIGIGPGIQTHESTVAFVAELYRSAPQPMIVDADGLNCLVEAQSDLADHAGPRILTPHPGEFRRLVGQSISRRNEMEALALDRAKQWGVTLVLKGHRTWISDGEQSCHNQTGNVGMATGGSGDVLTGVITALVGQGMGLLDAARLGCHLHGMAGDLAADRLGQVSLISTDLLDFLPPALMAMGPSK